MNDRIHPAMLAALKPFAPPERSKYDNPPCPRGLIDFELCPSWMDEPLDCWFDYTAADDGYVCGVLACPPNESSMELSAAWVRGADIVGAMGETQRERLEELASVALAQRREDEAIDRAESRARYD